MSGEITAKRKLNTVQIIREPKVVIASMSAEDALSLAEDLIKEADKALSTPIRGDGE